MAIYLCVPVKPGAVCTAELKVTRVIFGDFRGMGHSGGNTLFFRKTLQTAAGPHPNLMFIIAKPAHLSW